MTIEKPVNAKATVGSPRKRTLQTVKLSDDISELINMLEVGFRRYSGSIRKGCPTDPTATRIRIVCASICQDCIEADSCT